MLAILAGIFLVVIIWNTNKNHLLTINQRKNIILDHLIFLTTFWLGNKMTVESTLKKTEIGSKNLVIANHPSVLDFAGISFFHQKVFPNHKPIFIIKKSYQNIPIIGKCLKDTKQIFLYKNITEDELTKYEEFLVDNNDPFVLYLFPEGTTFCKETFQKSLQTETGKGLNHLLFPRSKAFERFVPICEYIIDLTIVNHGGHAEYFSNLLWGAYPFHTVFYTKNVTDRFKNKRDPTSSLLTLWKEKDEFLSQQNAYQYPELVDLCGTWIHLWLVFLDYFLRQRVGSLVYGLVFVYSCYEYYVWKRHDYLNKACFLLFFLSKPGLLFLFHIFINSLFSLRVVLTTLP